MNTSVRGAERALRIFEAFGATKRQLTLREVATYCGLPVSSCHALLRTLHQGGYLYTFGKKKEMYPNGRLLTLAKIIVEHDPFLPRILSDLETLRDLCGETVTVAKQQGDVYQYIQVVDCARPIRYAAKVGEFRPLHSTASGKALLSMLTEGELEHWLDTHRLHAMSSKTLTGRGGLRADINAGRRRGYFVAFAEHFEDVGAVAIPVKMHNDVIAVALAGPMHRMRPAMSRLGARLLDFKKTVEAFNEPRDRSPNPAARRAASVAQKRRMQAA